MSGTKWTKEQLDAITESGCNLLVAAAAGAGKTAVLVERLIRKITADNDPMDIDRLLIVTFTNAAATEMRERIGEAIAKALDKNPGSKRLQRQLALLNKASITTVHSFCLEVIRNNFQYIDLDPNFRIADQTESTLMKLEALEELFEDRYEDENVSAEFLELVECYGGSKDDRMLQDMVLTLYEFVQSHPWPGKWLDEKAEAFNIPDGSDFGVTVWAEVLVKSVRIELLGLVSMLHRAAAVISSSEGLDSYLSSFREDISNIEALLKTCDCQSSGESCWDDLYYAFSSIEFGRLPRCGKDADKDRQEQVKALRDEAKKKIRKINEDIFTSDSSGIIKDLAKLHPLIKCLCGLVMEFDKRYSVKKRQKSLLDFNDLEHFCLGILTQTSEDGSTIPSKVAHIYRERFEEVLVDEYQDSNLVQEVLLGMISRRDSETPNVFMVGDVKQSIYRFRQAKPELFLDKYNTYSGESGAKSRKIQLYKNFRSRKEVIDGVNFIFKQIMSKNIGELDYNDEEALNLGSSYIEQTDRETIVGGAVELHIIDGSDLNSGESVEPDEEDHEGEEGEEPESVQEEAPDSIQSEARIVVKRIKELMTPDKDGKSFKVYDKSIKDYRKVEYKDIVILLRTTKNWADVFKEELSAQGIPAYADSATGYFRTIEVQVVMSLLQIIDNPMQDVPLLAVLRSPIGLFTPEELIDIRLADRETSIYEAMKKAAEDENNGAAPKAVKFLESLERWRNKALYMSTDELIWYLYTDTGYYSYTGAMPGGIQRQANLRILFERARQYEQTSYKGLFNFINFINKLRSSSGDMGSAKILGENENVVRIMSIHKSKGLEFPVVIVSGCGKKFNLQEMNKSILVHQDMGFGPDFVDYKRRISYPTVPKQALRYKTRIESLSEEMRILYVAFTRAKEKLIITGTAKNIGKTLARWCGCLDTQGTRLPEYEMLRGQSYLDWVGPALIRHKGCASLRELAGVDGACNLLQDDSRWDVKAWNGRDILEGRVKAELQEQDFIKWIEQIDISVGHSHSKYSGDIIKRLGWEYPLRVSSTLPTKLSVTELKRRFNTEFSGEYSPAAAYIQPLVKRPAFLEESKGLTPAEKGTVMHFVMQHLDLGKVSSSEEIEGQVHGMVSGEMLTGQQAKAVDTAKVCSFFNNSPLGARMVGADTVNREVPFNIEIKSTEVYKDLPIDVYGEETILLQGVIDCYFEEQGEIVLVDYKTDYVPQGGTELMREKYRLQIEYYTRALEMLTGKRVKERYVYLFWNGEVIRY